MGRLAEVNRPCVLEVKTYDGDSTRTAQARVYDDAGSEQSGSPFTLTHFARGNYKSTSWTPTVQGHFIVNYEIYVDGGCITLDTNYVQFSEMIFVRSTIKALYDGISSGSCDGLFGRPAAVANTSTTIQLDSTASSVTDYYKGGLVQLVMFTGVGQSRVITAYNGTTKVATIGTAWITTPDTTTLFSIRPWDSAAVVDKTGYSLTSAEHTAIAGDVWNSLRSSYQLAGSFGVSNQTVRDGTAQSGSTSTTIKLDAGASSVNNVYEGNLVYIYSGTGAGQTEIISSYDGTTKIATVDSAWITTPDVTSKFIIMAGDNARLGSDGRVLVSADAHTSGETVANITSKTGYSLANGSIVAATFSAGAIDANAIATDAIGANELAQTAIDEIAAGILSTPANKLTTYAGGTVNVNDKTGFSLANASITNSTFATDAIDANALKADAITEIGGGVWDIQRSTHQVAGSFGLSNQTTLDGTAAASGASTITLDSNASAIANLYNGNLVYIYSGTGAGQTRIISAYSSGKVATVSQPWTTALDGTSKYIVLSTRNALLGSDGKVLVSDGAISNTTFATDAIDANAIAANSIDASALSTDAVTEITNAVVTALLVTPANKLTTDVSGFVTLSNGSLSASKFATDAIDANALATSAVTEIAGGILLDNTKKIYTDAFGNVSIAQIFPTNFSALDINGSGEVTIGTNNDKTDYTLTNAEHTAIGADVWDVQRTSHQVTGSFGVSNQVARDATAQAGSTSTTIKLDAASSAVNDFYNNSIVFIMAETGAGQSKLIKAYDGTSKVATVDSAWTTTPDNTSKFTIIPFGSIAYQIFDKVIDVKTFAQVQEIILAYATGKIIRTGNNYEYEKQDNVTPLFTLQSNPGDRTRL